MKKFKNTFSVRGTHQQLMAFAEFAQSIGWQYQHRVGCEEHPILYFSTTPHAVYKSMSCWLAINALVKCYDLPAQWQAAMDAASEVEEEIGIVPVKGYKYKHIDSELLVLCACTEEYEGEFFAGVSLTQNAYRSLGEYRTDWYRKQFHPYNHPVTL